MQYNRDGLARTTSVQQKVRDVSVRLSIAAAILGSSVVGVAAPMIVRAQTSGAEIGVPEPLSIVVVNESSGVVPIDRYYAPYSPASYEAWVAARKAEATGLDPARDDPNLYLDYRAENSSVREGDSVAVIEVNPNSSGASYRPYVPSIDPYAVDLPQMMATPVPVDLLGTVYANSQTPIEQQVYQQSVQPQVGNNAPATPIASVDLMRGVYANSQTPIEQQVYQQSVQPQVGNNAPATPIASVDLMRGVYGDNANLTVSQTEESSAASDVPSVVAPIPYRSPVMPDQNDGRDNLVITADGWFVSPDMATNAPVASIALVVEIDSVDQLRDVFKDGRVNEEAYRAFLASRSPAPSLVEIDPADQLRYVYENGHVTVDALNGFLLAQGHAPVVARPPVNRVLARGVIGDELFLYPVTESPVAAEDGFVLA